MIRHRARVVRGQIANLLYEGSNPSGVCALVRMDWVIPITSLLY